MQSVNCLRDIVMYITRQQEIVLVDAQKSKITYRFSMGEISKISFDKNEPQINIEKAADPYLLFRIVLKDKDVVR